MVIIYATFPGRVEIDDMRNVTLKGPQELEQQLEGVQGQRVTLVKWVTQHLCDL